MSEPCGIAITIDEGGFGYHRGRWKTMQVLSCFVAVLVVVLAASAAADEKFETDVIKTSAGDLEITFIGHATLIFTLGETVVHVDPVGQMADYTKLPKADLILITHEHGDHLDPKAVETVRTDNTEIVLTEACAKRVQGGIVMKNGDTKVVKGFKIEAVPAYNIVHKRGSGQPFHPKGVGNGYVVAFGDKRVYIAGDTENTPEMKALEDIDIAFLPMNLPYTMTPEMVADAAKAFRPRVLYPYHFSETDTSRIVDLLRDVEGIDVRIRKMK
jgi:L-ascorbate metabolism protein UlaG (beta-lactamase superfamily)